VFLVLVNTITTLVLSLYGVTWSKNGHVAAPAASGTVATAVVGAADNPSGLFFIYQISRQGLVFYFI